MAKHEIALRAVLKAYDIVFADMAEHFIDPQTQKITILENIACCDTKPHPVPMPR